MLQDKIGVIVVNWKQDELTQQCLNSLRKQNANYFVVLVENECVGGSAFERMPGVLVVKNEKNLGYSKAVNQGMEVALREQPAALLLLNNDAFFEQQHGLRILLESLERDEQNGAVAPALIQQNGTYVHKWAVLHPILGPEFIGMNQAVDPPGLYQADYLSACCILIRAKALEEVGGWDEDFFIYFDDMDWSHRARQKGWLLMLQTAVSMHHYDSFTTNQYPKLKYHHMGRGRSLFIKKHLNRHWKYVVGSCAYYIKNMVWNNASGRRQVYWELKGFVSALFG